MPYARVNFGTGATGYVTGDCTLAVWANDDGASVSTTSWALTELANGMYVLSVPAVSEPSTYRVYVTADSAVECVGGIGDELGGFKLGDLAHGGGSTTITTSSGELGALADGATTLSEVQTLTLPIRQFLANNFYECGSWDGGFAGGPLTVTFSGTLGTDGWIELRAWDILQGDTSPILLGTYTSGGWSKAGGWSAALHYHSLALNINDVTVGGTLTIVVKDGASYIGPAGARTITIDIPAIGDMDGNSFFPTNTGLLLMYGTTHYVTPGLDAAGIRSALGMIAADLDTQLDAIVQDTGATLPAQIAGITTDVVSALNSISGIATEASVQAIASRIESVLATGTIASYPVVSGNSGRTIGDFFSELRLALRDINANAYSQDLVLAAYNRAVEEISLLLIRLGADVQCNLATITGDGVHHDFALPTDFRAFAMGPFPRNPATATSNFSHGRPLTHVDQLGTWTSQPTTVGTPTKFKIITSSSIQYISFDTIPTSGIIFDGLYFTTAPRCASTAAANTTYMPWLGLLDTLIARTMELYLRESLEYTLEARELWRQRAVADIVTLLGLRHLQSRNVTPSMWRDLPPR